MQFSKPAWLLLSYGGDEGNRTLDLLNAIQALSQLSYVPKTLVEMKRIELSTSRMRTVRSPS